VEVIEFLNYLDLGRGASDCAASISEFDDYASDSIAVIPVQALQYTVVTQPFKNFRPPCIRALVPVVEKAKNSVVFFQAVMPALPERLVKKLFDYLIQVNHRRADPTTESYHGLTS
jgi:hypothetical protein